MSVQTEITRIESAKTSIATAIEGKGVTVPEGTKLDGMAALIESIEASGGGSGTNVDWRGFPVLTGTFTPSEDISSDYTVSFQEGERLHYKTIDGSGAKWQPMFLLFPDTQNVDSDNQGYIQNIGSFPNTAALQDNTPSNTGTIFAYTAGTSVNTTYVKGVYDNKILQTGFNAAAPYQDVTITSVKIPATSKLKLKSGLTYRWLLYAGIYAGEVSIV